MYVLSLFHILCCNSSTFGTPIRESTSRSASRFLFFESHGREVPVDVLVDFAGRLGQRTSTRRALARACTNGSSRLHQQMRQWCAGRTRPPRETVTTTGLLVNGTFLGHDVYRFPSKPVINSKETSPFHGPIGSIRHIDSLETGVRYTLLAAHAAVVPKNTTTTENSCQSNNEGVAAVVAKVIWTAVLIIQRDA